MDGCRTSKKNRGKKLRMPRKGKEVPLLALNHAVLLLSPRKISNSIYLKLRDIESYL
jgi:hypothetical protein